MKEFEEACACMNIKLFALPPKRPQWNGGVERGNRIFREEFYSRKDILADLFKDCGFIFLNLFINITSFFPMSMVIEISPPRLKKYLVFSLDRHARGNSLFLFSIHINSFLLWCLWVCVATCSSSCPHIHRCTIFWFLKGDYQLH